MASADDPLDPADPIAVRAQAVLDVLAWGRPGYLIRSRSVRACAPTLPDYGTVVYVVELYGTLAQLQHWLTDLDQQADQYGAVLASHADETGRRFTWQGRPGTGSARATIEVQFPGCLTDPQAYPMLLKLLGEESLTGITIC